MLFYCTYAVVTIRHSKGGQAGAEVKKEAGILNAIAVDGVQGIKDIISFGWQNIFKRFLQPTSVIAMLI